MEDKASKSSVKVSLPVGQEVVITLKNGQKFIIHTSDPQQGSGHVWEEIKHIYVKLFDKYLSELYFVHCACVHKFSTNYTL